MSAITLPNLLSISRFVLTPFGIQAILNHNDHLATILCLLASATDFADGYAARRMKAESQFGALLDPLADKFMLNALYLTLWFSRGIWLGIWVLARDVMILLGSAIIHFKTGRRDFPPSHWGKVSTLFQMTWIVWYLGGLPNPGLLQIVTLSLTLVSGIDYLRLGIKMLTTSGTHQN